MTDRKVVVVTGANRGIGLEICRQIGTFDFPITLYACSRSGVPCLTTTTNPDGAETLHAAVDITSAAQIAALARLVRDRHGHVDVLINNAGTTQYTSAPLAPREYVATNYLCTLEMCRAFLPLLAPGGRIVNVSSAASTLSLYPPAVQKSFRDPNLTIPGIDEILARVFAEVDAPGSALARVDRVGYYVSKACVNAATAVLARENPQATINACCPGWCDTAMGRVVGVPPKSAEDGARIVVRMAFGDVGGVSGRYWANGDVGDTGLAEVVEW